MSVFDDEFGGDYARDGGWSGGGRRDDYTREPAQESDRDAPAQPAEPNDTLSDDDTQ